MNLKSRIVLTAGLVEENRQPGGQAKIGRCERLRQSPVNREVYLLPKGNYYGLSRMQERAITDVRSARHRNRLLSELPRRLAGSRRVGQDY